MKHMFWLVVSVVSFFVSVLAFMAAVVSDVPIWELAVIAAQVASTGYASYLFYSELKYDAPTNF